MRGACAALSALLVLACAGVSYGFAPVKSLRSPHASPLTAPTAQGRVSTARHMVIPGDSVVEAVVLGGTVNFLGVYNILITARVLLSWFPQAQGVALLQPIFTVTEPFLKLFRGLIPPIFGFDVSLILALFLLQTFTTSVGALGAPL
ncbi:YGGT family-domain-containing protein [Pelagophyceae sp. CCMP2097]|nr:YGGT family-domain-containing protein [Pelagophyceae sp. CCMP2097]